VERAGRHDQFPAQLNTGEVEIDGPTIYHVTEYRERRNHFAFFHVNHPVSGFDTDREAFVGTNNGLHEPAAVVEDRPRNSVASGWSPIASHCLPLELAPGERREITFLLAYAENPADAKWESPGVMIEDSARQLIAMFRTPEAVTTALTSLREHWAELLGSFQLRFEDEAFQIARNGEGSVAESVLIAGMFAFIGDEYAALLHHLGNSTEARIAEAVFNQARRPLIGKLHSQATACQC
jgi:cellobiose phosphorylase